MKRKSFDRSPDTPPLLLDHHLASFNRIHPSPKSEKILVEHWARGIEIDIRDIAAPGIKPSLNGCMIGIVAHGFLHIRLMFRCTIGVSQFWEGATSLPESRRETAHVQNALAQRRETAVAHRSIEDWANPPRFERRGPVGIVEKTRGLREKILFLQLDVQAVAVEECAEHIEDEIRAKVSSRMIRSTVPCTPCV